MIEAKLTQLAALLEEDPFSPAARQLAQEINAAQKTEEEDLLVEAFFEKHLNQISTEIEILHESAVKLQLAEISDMLNLAYIAKFYFNKSRAWLSQRINGNKVNGKPCKFTPKELEIFNSALKDMGKKLSNTQISY